MNKVPNQHPAQADEIMAVEIRGNRRHDIAEDYEDDLQMTAGRDRGGFIPVRRNAKKAEKSDRY
ncbi:hypothetical protein [Methylomonas sp. UP202]|uniref:hypothetical protein n=1 Tax=Methylomonas sp. UP202 TaxID=3040943 RepID=UPI002478B227|nr:hypothetical protein [Methylomonas sp. UP202]WGS88234.1 hypothetical protein QC632_10835 [Methylomonas sp. UP202]